MLTTRSEEKELIDLGPDYYTAQEYSDCMNKLFKVNKLLGFFSSTVRLLRLFPKKISLLDIGCGNGLFVLHLSQYFPEMSLRGIDISENAIQEASLNLKNWRVNNSANPILFELALQPELNLTANSVDVILATLLCHHLTDSELILFLQQAYFGAKQAVIINDLHRHRLSQWLYRLISPILFRNRLITHDGLISIRRGFTRKEWKLLLEKSGITQYQIKWCLPFRWRVILWKR